MQRLLTPLAIGFVALSVLSFTPSTASAHSDKKSHNDHHHERAHDKKTKKEIKRHTYRTQYNRYGRTVVYYDYPHTYVYAPRGYSQQVKHKRYQPLGSNSYSFNIRID